MPYWIIVAEHDEPLPLGTSRVIQRDLLPDGRVKWVVEGAEFMNILPGVIRGIISVERFDPDDHGSKESIA